MIWNFFAQHKKAVAVSLVVGVLLCAGLMTQLKLDENILSMIPANVRERVELFNFSPLNKKIFLGVTAPSAEEAQTAAEALRAELAEENFISLPPAPGPEFGLTLFKALPYRFTASDEQVANTLITAPAVQEKMTQNYENLLSFQGFLLKDLIQADPVGLTSLMTQKLAALGAGTALDYKDGFLSSADGKTLIGPYDAGLENMNFAQAQAFDKAFGMAVQKLPSTVHAFYLGALRYTVENVRIIRADLIKISLCGLLLLAGIFYYFFRHKTAILIYLLPVFVLMPAALVTYAVFGELSGITLGFGSVVAGLSVDYSVYLFFALRQTAAPTQEVVSHLKKHLLCNFMTSSLCFLALFCSSVEVFRQIAVFAVTGLVVALFLAMYIFPHYWDNLPKLTSPTRRFVFPHFSRAGRIVASLCLLAFGVWGVMHTQFSGNVEELNGVSSSFRKDKKVFDEAFDAAQKNTALLFVFGENNEDALQKNERLSAQLPTPLTVSGVVPSQNVRRDNLARWQAYWNPLRTRWVRTLLEKEAKEKGLQPKAFEPFFVQLENPAEDEFDFTELYSPLVPLADGRTAVVNMVPNEPLYQQTAHANGAVFLSASDLKQDLLSAMGQEALKIVCLALFFNLVAVKLALKSWKHTLLAFVPVVLAACFTFGSFWLLGVRVNLFVLVFLPLLMGLGIDYGIFQVMKSSSVGSAYQQAYSSRALLAAGLSTVAGFGVLVLAKHGVLFMIGLSSVLGVGGAMLSALFILPGFLEERCDY